MLTGVFLAASFAGLPSAAITRAPEVQISGREIRLRDVGMLDGGRAGDRARIGESVIAKLPEGRDMIAMRRSDLASLSRRSVPGLSVSGDETAILIRSLAPKPVRAPRAAPVPQVSADVDKGDQLTLVSAVGPVRIQRRVVALQPGRGGKRVFVRDEDGQVLSVPLSLAAEKGEEQ